jgi:hypothetical protein
MTDLPITVIRDTAPPKFRWTQLVDSPVGKRTVEHEGELPPSVEGAVRALIALAGNLAAENERLLRLIEGQTAELERSKPAHTPPVVVPIKKGKGAG